MAEGVTEICAVEDMSRILFGRLTFETFTPQKVISCIFQNIAEKRSKLTLQQNNLVYVNLSLILKDLKRWFEGLVHWSTSLD